MKDFPLRRRRRTFLTMVNAVGLFLSAFTPGVDGATFTVTRESDGNGPCELDDCSLREAIIAANASPGRDTIIVRGGTYTLSIPGPNEYSSMTGDLDVLDDVAIVGGDETPAVIVGDGTDRVLSVQFASVDISNVTITGGVGASGLGGGIFIIEGNMTVTNSTIRDNVVPIGDGGGLYVSGLAAVVMENCTISNNFAERSGGGIMRNGGPFGANLTLINTTVSGNSASRGGGITSDSEGTLFILNSTIADNVSSASRGDGFFFSLWPTTEFTNTIIGGDCAYSLSVAPISHGGNLESPGATCGLTDPTDQVNVPDVGLRPLAANGGPTMTHALVPGSPAIDAAGDAPCPAADQRGMARPVDGDGDSIAACDVGAYEAARPLAIEVPSLAPASLLALALLVASAGLFSMRRPVARNRCGGAEESRRLR